MILSRSVRISEIQVSASLATELDALDGSYTGPAMRTAVPGPKSLVREHVYAGCRILLLVIFFIQDLQKQMGNILVRNHRLELCYLSAVYYV